MWWSFSVSELMAGLTVYLQSVVAGGWGLLYGGGTSRSQSVPRWQPTHRASNRLLAPKVIFSF